MSSLFDASEEKTNGTRLARLLIDGGTHVLREFLHSLYPSATFPAVLNNNFTLLQKLKSNRKIFDGQWEQLFPPSGDPPNTKTFDITLLHLLLREICFSLVEPVTGWHDMPADSDSSPEAHIARIKCFRNDLCHSISTGIANDEFQAKWTVISNSLVALGLDPKEISRLKIEPIDHDAKRRLEEEIKKYADWEPRVYNVEQQLQQLQGQLSGLSIQESRTPELCSCLPDEVPEAFGRSQEIQQATEAIQSGVAIVLITGAPGFGKTTVANKVAHELVKPQYDRTVLYCSLRSIATLNDVATSMILACSTNHSQPPENPQHWLLNWSKQQLEKITFVLDYADDALESQDSRNQFVNMMRNMRTLSKQTITFIITSRKTFNATGSPDLRIKDIRLGSLSPDEAMKLLLSKVHTVVTKNKLSQTRRMVELCGCVPLALCIVGSLLSDYKEARLIRSLEKEPLDVIQDDDISFENTIQTSFDLLDKREQKALVMLAVFPGSFDVDAAEAVITASVDQGSPMMILRTLKNRSLLEQPISGKYQVHQLIQSFAKKIGRANYPQLLVDIEKVACANFVSRLSNNAEIYWSKDKCRESIEFFNEDRYNFEYFLQAYVEKMSEKPDLDPLLETCTKRFLDQFPQKCMYLETCLLPNFYIMILEKYLMHFKTRNQPVHTVELLCLLAHEKRKIGNLAGYKDLMEQANIVYYVNYTKFRPYGLSQVLFYNSYARFLFEKGLPSLYKMSKDVYRISLNLCNTKLKEHPEKAATLLFIGKQRKDISVLEKATFLLIHCLGEHVMTAQGHKAIADVFFSRQVELERSLDHYEQALAIMEKCGMGGHKETALTLKNYAVCQRRKGNYQEANTYLAKAKQVAEIELDEDHLWKVMIDTQLALLHEDFGLVEEAITIMKNALEMCSRLHLQIDRLGNKHEIWEFLVCYHRDIFKEHTFLFIGGHVQATIPAH